MCERVDVRARPRHVQQRDAGVRRVRQTHVDCETVTETSAHDTIVTLVPGQSGRGTDALCDACGIAARDADERDSIDDLEAAPKLAGDHRAFDTLQRVQESGEPERRFLGLMKATSPCEPASERDALENPLLRAL